MFENIFTSSDTSESDKKEKNKKEKKGKKQEKKSSTDKFQEAVDDAIGWSW